MNLNLQKSMKAEMEVAMKLLEKDVHEKQDTIRALRDQLEDIKSINLDMYTKLQVRTRFFILFGNSEVKRRNNTNQASMFHKEKKSIMSNFPQFFAAQQKECEEEISLKSDVISRLESKTEEISRLLIRLNDMPPGT